MMIIVGVLFLIWFISTMWYLWTLNDRDKHKVTLLDHIVSAPFVIIIYIMSLISIIINWIKNK